MKSPGSAPIKSRSQLTIPRGREKDEEIRKQDKQTYEPPHDKTIKMTVRPGKTQISLGIRPVV